MSEVSAVSEVLESLKRARFARASKVSGRNYAPLRHWQVNKSCPVLYLPGMELGARGYMALQGLITRVFPR